MSVGWRPSVATPEHMARAFQLTIAELYSFLCKGSHHLYVLKRESGFVAPLYFVHGTANRTMFLMYLLTNDLVERSVCAHVLRSISAPQILE